MSRKHKPAKLKITSYRNRLIDIDNICVKFIIDGLVESGVLVDDSPEFVESVEILQVKSKDEKTLVEIKF